MSWLKERRIDLNYTQKEIAAKIGVTDRQYRRYEQEGDIGTMTFERALKLAQVLHLSIKQFIEHYETK